MTTISAAEHPLPTATASGVRRAVSLLAAVTGIGLAAVSLTDEVLPAGAWVRAAVVATWAVVAIVLALRAHEGLGVVCAGGERGRRGLRGHRHVERPGRRARGRRRAGAGRRPARRAHHPRRQHRQAGPPHPRPGGVRGGGDHRPGHGRRRSGARRPDGRGRHRARPARRAPGRPPDLPALGGARPAAAPVVGCAVAVAVEVALVVAALRLLVDWPDHGRRGRRRRHRPRPARARGRHQPAHLPPGRPAARAHRVGHRAHRRRRRASTS